ncbi:MAG: DUF1905 domain-containing protein [Bacteroidota bacterium]
MDQKNQKQKELPSFKFEQAIRQLEKRRGGYFYFQIDADIVHQFERKKATRLICTLPEGLSFRCGLNHLGDGNFFIILATKLVKALKKDLGDVVAFEISEDPNPLGVDIPEVLEVLLDQDENAKELFNQLTDGKKRGLIHTINRIKNIDKKVNTVLEFLNNPPVRKKKS